MGLRRRWSGTRPVLKDSNMTILATSEVVAAIPYVPIPKKPSLLGRIYRYLRRIKVAEVELDFREVEKRATLFHEKHANAWVKNYNPAYPNSGLFRIWDYGPRHLTDDMLEELSRVIDAIVRRIS